MNRTQALMKALGYQGGTVHQVAEECGITVEDILYGEPEYTYLSSPYSRGRYSISTNDLAFNKEFNFPQFKGNKDYWLGVIDEVLWKEQYEPDFKIGTTEEE